MRPAMTKKDYRNNQIGEVVRKTVTFSNTTGTVNLFTVTGCVAVQIIPVCTTDVVSAAAANMEAGVSSDTDALIASTLSTDLAAGEIWVDATPDSKVEMLSNILEFIVADGEDIDLTLSAQVDLGEIDFNCFWFPISEDGDVVPA